MRKISGKKAIAAVLVLLSTVSVCGVNASAVEVSNDQSKILTSAPLNTSEIKIDPAIVKALIENANKKNELKPVNKDLEEFQKEIEKLQSDPNRINFKGFNIKPFDASEAIPITMVPIN